MARRTRLRLRRIIQVDERGKVGGVLYGEFTDAELRAQQRNAAKRGGFIIVEAMHGPERLAGPANEYGRFMPNRGPGGRKGGAFPIPLEGGSPSTMTLPKMNPGTVRAPLRGDKRKTPTLYSFRSVTLEEAKSWTAFGRVPSLYFQDQHGRMANVRLNGKVQTWKRDPSRISIPVKFGMYEAFRIEDPSELFVLVSEEGEHNPRKRGTGRRGKFMRSITRRGKKVSRRAWQASGFRRNGELRDIYQIGPNTVAVYHGDVVALYDYGTPVAVAVSGGGPVMIADTFYSKTTSRHINQWIQSLGHPGRKVERVSPEKVQALVRSGSFKRNPAALAVVGANPRRFSGVRARVLEIRYRRSGGKHPGLYKHAFKHPAFVQWNTDGSITIREG